MRITGIPYVQGRNSYSDADGTKYGVAIHNTSNTASADNEASYATRRTDGVSAHFYVDQTKVVQSLDTAARAGHAGSSEGNQNAVAVEIRGVNAWPRATWLDSVCWPLLGRVLADVCRAYGIQVRRATVGEMKTNPRVRAFYSHDDMRQAWGGTDHTDPGPNFPWDRLFNAVNAALSGGGEMEQSERLNPPYPGAPALAVGNALNIAVETRDGLWKDLAATGYGAPKPGSALGLMLGQLGQLVAAATEERARDAALAEAVRALAVGAGVDPDALLARVEETVTGAVRPLQEQLAAVQARNVKLAQALAAAGGALDAADDE